MKITAAALAQIIAQSAAATIRQLAGVDPDQVESAARAIGNNAAMIIDLMSEESER